MSDAGLFMFAEAAMFMAWQWMGFDVLSFASFLLLNPSMFDFCLQSWSLLLRYAFSQLDPPFCLLTGPSDGTSLSLLFLDSASELYHKARLCSNDLSLHKCPKLQPSLVKSVLPSCLPTTENFSLYNCNQPYSLSVMTLSFCLQDTKIWCIMSFFLRALF